MATFDYAKTRDTADRLLTKFGQSVTISRTSRSGTPHDPTIATQTYPATAAIVEFSSNVTHFAGEQIMSGDKLALIAAGGLAIEPDPTTDKLIVGGIAHSIVKIMQINPGGVAVLYEVQIRR